MKQKTEVSRRQFLKLSGAAVLVCAAGALTGCGKKSKKELLVGEWYAGIERPSWIFYDDGTCELINDYGLGKWSLVNDDTVLNVSDFYGETHTFKLVSVDEDQMTLSMDSYDGTSVEISLFHSYEESMEKGHYNY